MPKFDYVNEKFTYSGSGEIVFTLNNDCLHIGEGLAKREDIQKEFQHFSIHRVDYTLKTKLKCLWSLWRFMKRASYGTAEKGFGVAVRVDYPVKDIESLDNKY